MREGIHQEMCRGKIKNRMKKKKSKRNHQESVSIFSHTPSDKNVLVRQLYESPYMLTLLEAGPHGNYSLPPIQRTIGPK